VSSLDWASSEEALLVYRLSSSVGLRRKSSPRSNRPERKEQDRMTGRAAIMRKLTARRRGLSALLAAVALVCLASPLAGVPVRPDLIDSLRTEGKLDEFVATRLPMELDACERGLDAPLERPGLLREGHLVSQAGVQQLRAVAILVDFLDNPADTVNYPPAYYEKLLFSMGETQFGSLREYFLENSYGKLDVTGAVTRWYRMPQLYSYYVAGDRGLGTFPTNSQGLARDAVLAADWDVNYANFDCDGPDGVPDSGDDDGLVDAVIIIHAGPGYETTLDVNDIQSHTWVLYRLLTLDGVDILPYLMQSETSLLGVYCHEFGHRLGLIDLYDRDYRSKGLGGWSLMAYGSWNQFGLRPAHLDAWSKIRAGFVTPVVPSENVSGLLFPPVEEEPFVYKLWDAGLSGLEYFLAERRERTGFDGALPADGLLIYHVDDGVPTNDDATHYRVALEQADGNWQLENCFNVGDDGDPYPGSSSNPTFGYETVPSSMTYSGGDSRVRVFNIYDTGTGTLADIWVQPGPQILMTGFSIGDGNGDGDGHPDPGETLSLNVVLKNEGVEAPDVTASLVSRSSCIDVEQSDVVFGTMEPGSERSSYTPFVFTVADTLSQDPFGAWFDLVVQSVGGYTTADSLLIGVGDVLGFEDDMEAPVAWVHEPASGGWSDEWRLTSSKAYEGTYSWVCSNENYGTYSPCNDAGLVTPVLLVRSEAKFVFYYWVDAHVDTTGVADDGGFVEVSANGAPWQQLTPVDGYPYVLKGLREPFIESRPVFSGTSTEWRRVECSLNDFANSAVRLRFRFISDSEWTVGEGWYIDSLTVATTEVPVLLGSLRATEVDGCVMLSWYADGELRNAPFSVWRDPGPDGTPGMCVVNEEPIVRERYYDFRDCSVAAGEQYRYWVGVEGHPDLLYGPVSVHFSGGDARVPRLELASANPVRDVLKLVLHVPASVDPSSVSLGVFDVSGRLVTTLAPDLGAGGAQSVFVEWNTSDYSGRPVASGVYFLKLDWYGGAAVEKIVVLESSRGR
jgi:immune inhibitor A